MGSPARVAVAAAATLALCVARPPGQGIRVTVNEPRFTHVGYTTHITEPQVTSPAENPAFVVFDMAGHVVNTWQDPLPNWAFAELVKPLSNGAILGLVYDRATVGRVPRSKRLVELDWSGAVRWQYDPSLLGLELHHDFQRLPNGHTIVIGAKARLLLGSIPVLIWDEVLLEIDGAGQPVWAWSTWDHAAQLGLSAQAWSYLLSVPGSPKSIFHMNSVQALPPNAWESVDPRFAAGNLLVSLRDTNLVLLIDKPTGQIVWRYTGAIGQHHARMIERDLPGAGNILLLDNGGTSGAPPVFREYSRVVELDPISQSVVWRYECRGPPCRDEFFTEFRGSAQRLPNGNTLIAESDQSRVFEVTRAGATVWEYVSGGKVVNRAYRWSLGWPSGPIAPFSW